MEATGHCTTQAAIFRLQHFLFFIDCDVSSTAVFSCNECIECFPSIIYRYLKTETDISDTSMNNHVAPTNASS
jgi:hypothetical protein